MKYINSPKNVAGIERAACLVGGLALLGNGIRTRGVSGMLQMATGGVALLRGTTGHCQVKQLLADRFQSASAINHKLTDPKASNADVASASDNTPAGRQAPVIQS